MVSMLLVDTMRAEAIDTVPEGRATAARHVQAPHAQDRCSEGLNEAREVNLTDQVAHSSN